MKKSNTLTFKGADTVASVNETSGLYSDYLRAEMNKIGMRASFRHVMKPLIENESLTQLELVNITRLKAPTISITLRNMEREGIVRREKNDADRRATHVYITDKGREMHRLYLEAVDRAGSIMLSGLTDSELKSVKAILGKMSENLRGKIVDGE